MGNMVDVGWGSFMGYIFVVVIAGCAIIASYYKKKGYLPFRKPALNPNDKDKDKAKDKV